VARKKAVVVKRKAVRTRAPQKARLKIPPILLEGDETPAPPFSGPGQRYALGPTPPAEHFPDAGELGELPEAYGTKRLLLAARDPQWLYAHWDLTRDQQRAYNRLAAEGHLVLRVYVEAVGGELAAEVHVHPESRHWFVHVGRAGTKYVAELGYRNRQGRWVPVSVSGATLTPPEGAAADTSVQFATLPLDVPLPKLAAMVRTLAAAHVPLVEAIEQLRAEGHPELPAPAAFVARPWTPEQERALAEVVNVDQVRRVWVGSLEITELVRQQLFGELASLAAAQIPSPHGALGSVSSPFGGVPQAMGFWFNLNAEIILYGATEPDATVTIAGRRIQLRPDGTFSYRFALPDGQYPLAAAATSADGGDVRWANLYFIRGTEYGGGAVGAHPQDPGLKTPTPENT